jgi:polyhydroxyalkanoate synthase
LSSGRLELAGHIISLSDITIPVCNIATRDDHIAPAKSVFLGSGYFGGEVEYIMAGSGHIAGVVNPPALKKYQFWTGEKPVGDFESWLSKATEHPGSWWPYWQKWIEDKDSRRVPARTPGGTLEPLGDAPGTYVKMRA